MHNGHHRDANDWKHILVYSVVSILAIAVTALGAPDYFDREPINTKFEADKPVANGATTYDDIRQGESPTCCLMAALSAAARSGIDLSKNIKYLGGKDYSVKLFVKGAWTEVKVSFKGWTKYDPIPNEGAFWVSLFQRAYLKALEVDCSDPDADKWRAFKEGKENLDWLRPSIALRTVTGQPAKVWWLDQDDAATTIKRIREAVQERRSVVVTTKGKNSNLVADKTCLVGCHAYSVTATGDGWIEVRNPWGRDIHRAFLIRRVLKNGREIFAFKDGYTDDRDDNPNDGIVRVGLDNIRFFDFAVVTAESN